MSRFAQRLVGLLWRWHRRTGVLIFVFLLLMVVTGVVLNHTSGLGLDRRFVHADWLLSAYGDDSAEITAYPVGDNWIARTVNGRLYFDATEVGQCRGELVGALAAQDLVLAGCAEEVVLLTAQGQLVEVLNVSTGLPAPLSAVGLNGEDIALKTAQGWRLADFDTLDFAAVPKAGTAISEIPAGALPAQIHAAIPAPAQWLTWERVLLDLHSGRLFGQGGVLLIDTVAILLACIACSGLTMWLVRRGRRLRN